MILHRLKLTNFRKYANLDLEFPEGLIGLVGTNGAGKTTLFEAIAFALYGVLASRTKGKGIRRDGLDATNPCQVELEFSYGGEPYRIVRALRGIHETQSAEIYSATRNKLLAHRTTGVESFVRSRLGMDYQTFTRSIFARQKEVAALSDDRPEERRHAIRRMMGIERIDKAIIKVRKDKKEKEEFIRGAEIAIQGLDDQVRDLARLTPLLKKAEKEYLHLQKKSQAQQAIAQKAQQKFEEQESAQKQFNAVDKQIGNFQVSVAGLHTRLNETSQNLGQLKKSRGQLKKLQPELREYAKVRSRKEQLDKAEGAYAEREQIESEIPNLTKAVKEIRDAAATQKKELARFRNLDKKMRANTSAFAKVEKTLNEMGRNLKGLRGKLGGKEERLAELKDSLQKLRSGREGRCPTCLRPLSGSIEEVEAHFAEERSKLELARQELQTDVTAQEKIEKSAETEKKKLQAEEKDLQRQQRAYDNADGQLNSLTSRLNDKLSTLKAKQKRLRDLGKTRYEAALHVQVRERLGELQAVYDTAQGLQREVGQVGTVTEKMGGLKTQLGNVQIELTAAKLRKKALAFRPKEYENARDAYQTANKALQAIQRQESDARVEFRQAKTDSDHLKKDIKEKQAQKRKIQADQKAVQYLAQLELVFKDFQVSLINRIRPLLANRASVLLDQITEGRYARIELDEGYQIFIQDGDKQYPIQRFSGGEEDLANLCLRVAISQTLAELVAGATWGIIALDEVFGSQDRQRRERLLRALQNLTGSFRQIFFITHLEDLHDRIQHVLQVSEDASGTATAYWAK